MKKKKKTLTIWLHSDTSSTIREVTVQKGVLMFFLFIIIISAAGISYVGHGYMELKKLSLKNDDYLKTIQEQTLEIKSQRHHIQALAQKIDALKEPLAAISSFEDKIRLIADIKHPRDKGGMFGIGGISENTLHGNLPLEQKHNRLVRELYRSIDEIDIFAAEKVVALKQLTTTLENQQNILACTPSITPIEGIVTCDFGYRKSPFTQKREFHSGMDIANKRGTEIYATANGRVSFAASRMFIGKLVVIDHGHGIVTKYGHMSKINVKKGDRVKRGDVIGLVGNTGKSTGPHIHYEVRLNGSPVNPAEYILD